MTLVLFILAGIVPLVSSKEIARDDMGMKFDALLDRIEVLENNVRSQNFVIQSQHDKMAAMKETINTQAEELKTQRKSIAQLQDTTRKLRFDVKRLDRRVETLERKTIVPRTFHSAADVHQTNFDSAPFDHIGNSTASKDRGLGIKLNSGQAFDDELGRNRDPQAKQNQHVNEKGIFSYETIYIVPENVRNTDGAKWKLEIIDL